MDTATETKLVPGVGRLPYPAYRGKGPYVFVSYAHADSDKVFAEIRRFNEAGFNVWYDEGIAPGNEWSDEIAEALSGCAVFVVMITPVSAPRENVQNEIEYALDEGKPFLAIHLEETGLPKGLKLRIGRKQAILKYNMTDEEYDYKYIEAFTRMGLKQEKTERPQPAVKAEAEPGTTDPKLAEAQKKAFDRITETDDFQIQTGLLKGYTGDQKDLILPASVTVLSAASFSQCRDFIESVDLNNVSIITAGTFADCPMLHTVKAGRSLKPIYAHVFSNCPEVTLYIRHDQLKEDFEKDFTGKKIVYTDEIC